MGDGEDLACLLGKKKTAPTYVHYKRENKSQGCLRNPPERIGMHKPPISEKDEYESYITCVFFFSISIQSAINPAPLAGTRRIFLPISQQE